MSENRWRDFLFVLRLVPQTKTHASRAWILLTLLLPMPHAITQPYEEQYSVDVVTDPCFTPPINKCLFPEDWLSIFPEAKAQYILPKLRELESGIGRLEKIITTKLQRATRFQDEWFLRETVKAFEVEDLVKAKWNYQKIKHYLPQKCVPGKITQEQIERAKQYPIIQIAEVHLSQIKRCGRAYRTLCPYHEERTPSFFLYQDSNTFHCFGCQEHGDVITLIRKLQCLSFIEAVKQLAPFYES